MKKTDKAYVHIIDRAIKRIAMSPWDDVKKLSDNWSESDINFSVLFTVISNVDMGLGGFCKLTTASIHYLIRSAGYSFSSNTNRGTPFLMQLYMVGVCPARNYHAAGFDLALLTVWAESVIMHWISYDMSRHYQTMQQGKDIWSYIWGSSEFTSSLIYAQLLGTRQDSPVYSWLWKSSCQPKRKVFCWLLLKDRLCTRELLKRKKNGFRKLQLCAMSPKC